MTRWRIFFQTMISSIGFISFDGGVMLETYSRDKRERINLSRNPDEQEVEISFWE